jgi:hypothetical protein
LPSVVRFTIITLTSGLLINIKIFPKNLLQMITLMRYTKTRNYKILKRKRWNNMEFPQRGAHQGQAASTAPTAAVNSGSNGGRSKKSDGPSWLKWVSFALLISVAVVLVGVVVALATQKDDKGEAKYVNSGKYQAVFLNGGQVYFGQVTKLNNSFLRLQDIYYLRVNQTVQPNQSTANQNASNDVSLVKLGCELHGPQDEMLINRDQVIFWENLKEDGQVAQAVAKYQQENPDGQKCQAPAAGGTTPATNGQ